MEPNDAPESESTEPVADELIKGMIDVVTAALGVGASLARTAARATALGKAVPEPSGSRHPINLIVHYGVATAMNLVGAVATGAGGVSSVLRHSPGSSKPDTTSPPASKPPQEAQPSEPAAVPPVEVAHAQPVKSAATYPSVKQGNSLRIPLSIENPSDEALSDLRFVCLGIEASAPVEAHAEMPSLSCEPESLNIAAHDFEKLTVHIDVPANSLPGMYAVTLGLMRQAKEGAENTFRTTIVFNVLPNLASPSA